MKTLLVVMAHPDDAELLCYGTMKKYVEKGYTCHLLLATRGEQAALAGSFKVDRLAETRMALENVDTEISCLDFSDGFVKQDHSLMKALQERVASIDPTVVITHYPDDGGVEHQDHNELGKAVLSVAIRYGGNLEKVLYAEPLFSSFTSFRPNLFVNIDQYYYEKSEVIKRHVSQENKFYLNERFLDMRACPISPYINADGNRFSRRYELFYQAYAVEF